MNLKKAISRSKTLNLIVLSFISISILNAQNSISNGEIVFEEVLKLDINVEGDAAAFAHLMPKEQKSKNILVFNKEMSLYEHEAEDKTEEHLGMNEESGGMVIKMQRPENRIFYDIENKKQINQREFMTRLFLIKSEVNDQGWKLTENKSEILGYSCQEAIKFEDSTEIRAWFTSAIPVSTGPAGYCDLPGMILAVDINNGEHTIVAKEITAGLNASIFPPKKGKKVSKDEFEAIVAEKLEESGIKPGSGPQVIVKVRQ